MYGKDMGMTYYLTNIRDAIRGLESLQPPSVHADAGDLALRDRLLRRLYKLLDEGPDRARVMAEGGGPETLLHGDLWPKNILAVPTPDGLRTRLIDWDATGVGPLTYDLSTFLYRFSAHHRPWILDRYQQAVAPLGSQAPATSDLSLLLETAEISDLISRSSCTTSRPTTDRRYRNRTKRRYKPTVRMQPAREVYACCWERPRS